MADSIGGSTLFREHGTRGSQTVLGLGDIGSNSNPSTGITQQDNQPELQAEQPKPPAPNQPPPTAEQQMSKRVSSSDRRTTKEIISNSDTAQIQTIMSASKNNQDVNMSSASVGNDRSKYQTTIFDGDDEEDQYQAVSPYSRTQAAHTVLGDNAIPFGSSPLGKTIGLTADTMHALSPSSWIEFATGGTYEDYIGENFLTGPMWKMIEKTARESFDAIPEQSAIKLWRTGIRYSGIHSGNISREEGIAAVSELAKLGTDLVVFKFINLFAKTLGKFTIEDAVRIWGDESGSIDLTKLRTKAESFFEPRAIFEQLNEKNAGLFSKKYTGSFDFKDVLDSPELAKIANNIGRANPGMTIEDVAKLAIKESQSKKAGLEILESKIKSEMDLVRAAELKLTGRVLDDRDLRNDAIDRIAYSFMSDEKNLQLTVPFTEAEMKAMASANLNRRASTPLQLREDMQAVENIGRRPEALTDATDLIKTEEFGRRGQEGKFFNPYDEGVHTSKQARIEADEYIEESSMPITDRSQSGAFSKTSDAPTNESTLSNIQKSIEADIIEARPSAVFSPGASPAPFGNIKKTQEALGRKLTQEERRGLKSRNIKIQETTKEKLRDEYRRNKAGSPSEEINRQHIENPVLDPKEGFERTEDVGGLMDYEEFELAKEFYSDSTRSFTRAVEEVGHIKPITGDKFADKGILAHMTRKDARHSMDEMAGFISRERGLDLTGDDLYQILLEEAEDMDKLGIRKLRRQQTKKPTRNLSAGQRMRKLDSRLKKQKNLGKSKRKIKDDTSGQGSLF